MKPEDSTAESLEQRGLWHRAARRWLTVMDATMDDAMREMLARRREHCLSMAANLPPDGRRAESRRREHCLSMAANLPPDGRRAESRRLYKARQRYNEGY